MDLEAELTRLYGLPHSDFVSARNALAKSLREDGDRDRAEEVRELEKPSLPAWAINQLQRSDPASIRRLAAAGERIGEIQAAALEGRPAEGLREASQEQLAAVGELMERARRDLGGELSAGALDRVEIALRNASVDEPARDLLLAGRLVHEPEATGFGALVGLPIAPGERPKRRASAAEEDRRKARRTDLREQVAAARRAVATSEKEAREAERAAKAAEKQAEQDRERLRKLESQLDDAKKG